MNNKIAYVKIIKPNFWEIYKDEDCSEDYIGAVCQAWTGVDTFWTYQPKNWKRLINGRFTTGKSATMAMLKRLKITE